MDDFTLVLKNEETQEEITCNILNIFEMDGRNYISLLPNSQEDDQETIEIQLYRYEEDPDSDKIRILPIMSDLEYDEVIAFFEKMLQ